MPSVTDTLKAKVGWDESNQRKVRVATGGAGLLLLCIGLLLQWYAGNSMSDIRLSTLCEAYSGEERTIAKEDWWESKKAYYQRFKEANPGLVAPQLTLEAIAAQFVGDTFRAHAYGIDTFLYSTPAFWCQYLPSCPLGAECDDFSVTKAMNYTRGAWDGRKVSTKPSWGMATGVAQFTSTRIRCSDKSEVYQQLLEVIYTDEKGNWAKDPVSGKACMEFKGSMGYILSLGPLLSSATCLICALSLCRWFQGATTASTAEGFAIVSVAMTLLSFWVVEYRVDQEFMQAYMSCGREKALVGEAPYMVSKGFYFDGTPCMDIDSEGNKKMNPYVGQALAMTSMYSAGGICNLIAIVLLLVSVSKIKEKSKLSKFQTLEASDEL